MASRFRVLLTDIAWPDTSVESEVLGACDADLLLAESPDEPTLIDAACGVDAIMTTWARVSAAIIDAAPAAKIVARLGIGLDNIDVRHCSARRIPVTNVPDYCLDEVAEHALALIFSLARKTTFFHESTKRGVYDLQAGRPLLKLNGKTVGVVGLGNIGRKFAAKCVALGMRVLAVAGRGAPTEGIEFTSFDDLVERSDFISLHAPLNPETRGMISTRQFERMKPTAYLINTARGGLVDHAAAEALRQGELAGAGLDVQDPEPPDLSESPWSDSRVIVTPHAAFLSEESIVELRRRGAEQVRDRLLGARPSNVVNPETLDD